MSNLTSFLLASSLILSSIGLAQASSISNHFQGKWINIGSPVERDPYCKTPIEQINPTAAKNLYIIQISPNSINHSHFDEHGHVVQIKHDNLRFKTNTDTQIRGTTRRDYESEHASRVYNAYSFRYDLANQKLTTPTVNAQGFYRCY